MYKTISEFPDYMISENGEIIKIDINGKKNILKPRVGKDGYYRIGLYKNKKQFFRRRCRLVAFAFIPNPDRKSTVNHINGIKTDDSVTNLEWATYSEQNIHAYKHGLVRQDGVNNNASVFSEDQIVRIRQLKLQGFKPKRISEIMNVNYYTMRHVYYEKTYLETKVLNKIKEN